ncbi:MAG: peroxiredoxin [Acidimicrobiia bacterium]|nr:peroxiredoxin [Acidimicrobiia bacterium]
MAPRVGEQAPDFELDGTDGTPEGHRRYRLSEFRGRPVVLVFYPGDDTPVCTVQLNSYTEEFPTFEGVGAQVLALSPQSIESHDRFAEKQGGFAFPLLADPDKEVGRSYGVVGPLGFYRRSSFVVDGQGVLRWVQRSLTGLRYPSSAELVQAVADAGHS